MRWLFLLFLPAAARGQAMLTLTPTSRFDTTLTPGSVHRYAFRLGRGYSLGVVVTQRGVDVVVEVLDARDSIIQSVDSPNGRNGPEPVELVSPTGGRYTLRVRPFDAREPEGRYTLEVTSWRNAQATRQLMARTKLARDSAAVWLAVRSAPLGTVSPAFDSLAARATVIGIGEATHGSREFGAVRLMLTRYLVEHHGYRLVAIEASASRLAWLDRQIAPGAGVNDSSARIVEWGWIGRRSLRETVSWLRQWNSVHPSDAVHLVGLDPQDAELARRDLRALLARAYPAALTDYEPVERELAAADSQTWVFGDSRVNNQTRRFLETIVAHGTSDAPLLARLNDSVLVRNGLEAAKQLLAFADFNSGGSDAWAHSRDRYMADNLLAAIAAQHGSTAVYWAHNAHVAAPGDRPPGSRPMGSWLRDVLGCRYAALAVTFGEGAFVAQIPNDLHDDLAVNTLPPAPDETIEGVLATTAKQPILAAWGEDCTRKSTGAPSWLQLPQRMHWVGALFRPGTAPSEAFRPFRLLDDFDGVVFFPKVTADELPTDRPQVPARRPERD